MIKQIKKHKYMLFLPVAAVLLCGLTACGGGSDDLEDTDTQQQTTRRRRPPAAQKAGDAAPKKIKAPKGGWIQSVSLTPTEEGEGASDLEVQVETTEPLEDDQRITYVFWKNNQPMGEEQEDNILPASFYKRGDAVYVEVRFYQDDTLLQKKRTEMVQSLNGPPVITDLDLPEIVGPGTYTIDVTVEDPDQDILTFSLEGELPPGLTIDSESGAVTWVLEDESPPETVTFNIVADDGNGGVTKKAVTFNFKIRKENEEEE